MSVTLANVGLVLAAALAVALLATTLPAVRGSRASTVSALGIFSVAITVAGIVTVLMARARFDVRAARAVALPNPVNNAVIQVTTIITVTLVLLATVNAGAR